MMLKLRHSVAKFDLEMVACIHPQWPSLLSSLPRLRHACIGYYDPVPLRYDFGWHMVPATLESLQLKWKSIFSMTFTVSLPNLTSLAVFHQNEVLHVASPDWKTWMPRLKSLKWITRSAGELSLPLLPSGLTELDGEFLNIKMTSQPSQWPCGLTRLTLSIKWRSTGNYPGLVQNLAHLPPSLLHLTLDTRPIQASALQWSIFEDCIPHLKTLDANVSDMTENNFRSLPRRLVSLTLRAGHDLPHHSRSCTSVLALMTINSDFFRPH
jgi:hypothetical protein